MVKKFSRYDDVDDIVDDWTTLQDELLLEEEGDECTSRLSITSYDDLKMENMSNTFSSVCLIDKSSHDDDDDDDESFLFPNSVAGTTIFDLKQSKQGKGIGRQSKFVMVDVDDDDDTECHSFSDSLVVDFDDVVEHHKPVKDFSLVPLSGWECSVSEYESVASSGINTKSPSTGLSYKDAVMMNSTESEMDSCIVTCIDPKSSWIHASQSSIPAFPEEETINCRNIRKKNYSSHQRYDSNAEKVIRLWDFCLVAGTSATNRKPKLCYQQCDRKYWSRQQNHVPRRLYVTRKSMYPFL